MNCMIKRVKGGLYFARNIDKNFNHWTSKNEARVFSAIFIAKDTIKKYNLKNVEIEKIGKIKNERKIFK